MKLFNPRVTRTFSNKCWLFVALKKFAHASMIPRQLYQKGLKGVKKKCQDQSGHMLSSESYKNVMFNFILKQTCVFLCARPFVKGQQGHKREKVSQTYLPD